MQNAEVPLWFSALAAMLLSLPMRNKCTEQVDLNKLILELKIHFRAGDFLAQSEKCWKPALKSGTIYGPVDPQQQLALW